MEKLLELYQSHFGVKPAGAELLPLSGSARKYFRISGEAGTVIGCKGTNLAENRAFLALDAKFREAGLHAPEVYAVSDDKMCYLQEDLGDGQLFGLLKPSIDKGSFSAQELGWLRRTMELLPKVQYEVGEGFDWSVCFPDRELNDRMVNFDLNYFKYDFLKFTGVDFNEIKLQDDFDRIREDAVNYTGDTFLYRDF